MGGNVEWWKCGNVEWWKCGMVEMWNGDFFLDSFNKLW
jgi:hypothetical protein